MLRSSYAEESVREPFDTVMMKEEHSVVSQ